MNTLKKSRINNSYKSILVLIIFLLVSSPTFAQNKSKKELPSGKPVLWESVNIRQRNLLLGPGGETMKPDLSEITFIEEEKGGVSTKYRIKDGSGKVWIAKVSKEAQSETASARLIWALGYKSEVNYLVPAINIPTKGSFTNVRLEARPDNVKRTIEWDWEDNPFVGTNELQGLKIMMAFLNNWDLKTSNNKILAVNDNGRTELQYIISDLGATIGKIGSKPILWTIQRSRNEPGDFAASKFVTDVEDGRIKFAYGGKKKSLFKDITIEQARWTANLLSQLSDEQIRDAFRAANYDPEEVEILLETVKWRIRNLSQASNEQFQAEK